MKVCWFGMYHRDYSRNQVLISGLESQGVEIVECNGINVIGIRKYWNLIKKLRSIDDEYDLLFCAFPINYNVIIAKLFQRKKIAIDAFFPLYDAHVHDRKILSPWSPLAILYFCIDWINIRLADLVITDTGQHAKYWKKLYSKVSVQVVPVGSYSKDFFPIPNFNNREDNVFTVSFHGSYIPLQGVPKIVRAVEIVNEKQKQIHFRFIGPEKMFDELNLRDKHRYPNLELVPWLNTEDLNKKLNEADIVLGIFGDTLKTNRVVPNKLFQGVAVKKAVITKDSLAIRELFSTDEILMIDNTAEALAEAIISLYSNREQVKRFGNLGHNKYLAHFTEVEIGRNIHNLLNSLTGK